MSSSDAAQNDAATIAELARQANGVQLIAVDDRKLLVMPEGFRQEDVSDEHGLPITRPRHVDQRVKIQNSDSLVEYVNRFKTGVTMLFADIERSVIVASLDYHGPSIPKDGEPAEANHVVHRAVLSLPFSEEWKTWTGASGKMMGQLEFARFIEENAPDINAPSAGEILDVCRDLHAVRKVNFVKAVRTSSDNENFEYTDETTLNKRGELEVPTKFALSLPVYFGLPNTEAHAFLRWALNEGVLNLGIKLHRAEHVRQAVFKQAVIDVMERTGCPIVYGSIEA